MENMDFEMYKKHRGSTINHFYEKLLKLKDMINTETGRKIALVRDAFMKEFLAEFYKEWSEQKSCFKYISCCYATNKKSTDQVDS